MVPRPNATFVTLPLRAPFTGLWRHPEFVKLWAGQSVSQVGSQVTRLALPLTAAVVLGATPAQMGALQAIETIPHVALGLAAGVWVDRLRRRPVMIAADLGRAALLGSIPLAALLGVLRIEQLYLVLALTATLTLFFDVAATSLLPSVVDRERLVDGNGKLAASASLAQVAGPGLAGVLLQVVAAPIAIAVDAASFVVSAACVRLMLVSEVDATPGTRGDPSRPHRPSAWREMGEGVRVLLGDPVLRVTAGTSGLFNLFTGVFWAVYLLYATRELRAAPAVLGLAFAAGGVGGVLGATLAAPVTRRFGIGPVLAGAALVNGIGWWPVVAAGGPSVLVGALLVTAHAMRGGSQAIYGITTASLRQAVVPPRVLGRVAATTRMIAWGTSPVGSLAGGLLGTHFGLRPTLALGALGGLVGFLWIAASPVPPLRERPAPAPEPAAGDD